MLYKQVLLTVIVYSVAMSTHTMGLDGNKSKSRSRKIRSAIQTLLRNSDVDVNTDWSPYGSSLIPGPPLFLAIQHCTDLVPVLLRRGASSNMRYKSRTPLHYAEDPRTALALIEAGADVNAIFTREGLLSQYTPLRWIALPLQPPIILTELSDVLHKRHAMMRVLLQHGADPNLCPSGERPPLRLEVESYLSKARHNNRPLRTIDLLLYHGADPYLQNSALSLAIKKDQELAHHLVRARLLLVDLLAFRLKQWGDGKGNFLPLKQAREIALYRYRYPSDDHEKNYVEILSEEARVFSSVRNGASKRQKINPGEG
jgi:hypothetical protein